MGQNEGSLSITIVRTYIEGSLSNTYMFIYKGECGFGGRGLCVHHRGICVVSLDDKRLI